MGCNASQPAVIVEPVPANEAKAAKAARDVGGFKPRPDVPERAARPDLEELAFHKEYMLGERLGRGSFAQVRTATKMRPSEPWEVENCPEASQCESSEVKQVDAVKIVSHKEHDDEKPTKKADSVLQEVACDEARIWKMVGQHPNCVIMYRHFFGNEFSYMVMERCEMSLLDGVQQMPDFTERGLGKLVAQMLAGLAHIHDRNVVHRDIKPDNFLLGGADGRTVKMTDFGLSAVVPQNGKVAGVFGTAPYMCPEMISGDWYGTKCDLWSIGVVMYVFLFGAFPYKPKIAGSKAMKKAIATGIPPVFCLNRNYERSEETVQLVKALIDRNPKTRLSAEEALLEPWIDDSVRGAYRPDADLPSLRPMLHSAKRIGAFDIRGKKNSVCEDELLEQMQLARYGNPPSRAKPSDDLKNRISEPDSDISTRCHSSSDRSGPEQGSERRLSF